MSLSAREMIELQATEHPLVRTGRFDSAEAFCLFLMHMRAYEEAAERSRGLKVLDLGCNTGYGTSLIAGKAASVVGSDVSRSALAEARSAYPAIDFRQFDGVSLPFGDAAFDVVASFQVIEHVVDAERYLREISRVLQPGGVALLTTPNAAIRLDPGMRPWNRFHVLEYRPREFREQLEKVFATTEIFGMFGAEELYLLEYRRCQSALAQHRKSQSPGGASDPGRRFASTFMARLQRRAAKALHRTRPGAGGRSQGQVFDRTLPLRFSTADMHYAATDLDRSLDLLAVCTKQ